MIIDMLNAEPIEEPEPPLFGIFPGISNAQYHADKTTFSSSLIKKMEVPLEAKYLMENPPEYKECFRIGSAIHKFILEREEFEQEFLTGISCSRRSNADREEWAQWFYSHGADGSHITSHKAAEWNGLFEAETGKNMVTPEEIAVIAMMSESVMANEKAIQLLEEGQAEASLYWQDKETGLHLRCRPDYLNSFCSDLKSCQSARLGDVSREIYKRGYHISQAVYQDGLQQVTSKFHPFLFIFIEKQPPYLCAVYRIDDEAAELGWNTYHHYLNKLAECLESDTWPGIDDDLSLSLPSYAFK